MSDLLTYQTASELPKKAKLLFTGDSGAGKTRLCCTAPKPVILLVEPNGLMTIQATNPDAVVVEATDLKTVYAFFHDAMSGRLYKETGCETIVIDSLTEMQRMIRDDILAQKGATPGSNGTTAKFTLADWGVLTDRMRKMIRTVRDLPFTVICTALAQYETDESSGIRYAMPSFDGRKMPNEICGYFSAVGYVYRELITVDDKQEVRHRVLFSGPTNYLTKGLPGLEAIEDPDATAILAKIGTDEATKEVADDPKKKDTSRAQSRRRQRAKTDKQQPANQ